MFELVLTGLIMAGICLIGMCICEQVHICKSRKESAIKCRSKKRKAEQERILLKLFAYAAFSACALTWAAAIMFFVGGVL